MSDPATAHRMAEREDSYTIGAVGGAVQPTAADRASEPASAALCKCGHRRDSARHGAPPRGDKNADRFYHEFVPANCSECGRPL